MPNDAIGKAKALHVVSANGIERQIGEGRPNNPPCRQLAHDVEVWTVGIGPLRRSKTIGLLRSTPCSAPGHVR